MPTLSCLLLNKLLQLSSRVDGGVGVTNRGSKGYNVVFHMETINSEK